MRDQLWQYILFLFERVPLSVYVSLLVILCLGLVIVICFRRYHVGWRLLGALILLEYVFLIFCSTTICRAVKANAVYNFTPFWSYQAYSLKNNPWLLSENLMNVVVFVPIGLLLGVVFRSIKWWQTLILGLFLSIMIETLQYVFKRGFSEFDDVMHNTLGCMIGFAIYSMVRCLPRTFGRWQGRAGALHAE